MATTIRIETGPLSAQRTFANDAKAQEALRRNAEAIGVSPTATNAQKLQFVVDKLCEEINRRGQAHYLAELNDGNTAQAKTIGLE